MPANNTQSTRANKEVAENFIRIPNIGGTDQAKCKHCGETKAWNTTQFCKRHLNACKKYEQYRNDNGITRPKAINKSITDFFDLEDQSDEQLFALAVYTSTANFSLFETPQWKAFFKRLNFTPPTRQRLSGELLKSCYLDIKQQVLKVAAAADHIQIVSDGSSNIAKVRVENVTFLAGGILYY